MEDEGAAYCRIGQGNLTALVDDASTFSAVPEL